MRKLLILALLAITFSLHAKEPEGNSVPEKALNISGKITDNKTKEGLTGVAVKVVGLNKTVYTDFDGNFEIKGLVPGKYDLTISMLSYKIRNIDKLEIGRNKINHLTVELECEL